mgnify:CR=1 FL=1
MTLCLVSENPPAKLNRLHRWLTNAPEELGVVAWLGHKAFICSSPFHAKNIIAKRNDERTYHIYEIDQEFKLIGISRVETTRAYEETSSI